MLAVTKEVKDMNHYFTKIASLGYEQAFVRVKALAGEMASVSGVLHIQRRASGLCPMLGCLARFNHKFFKNI